MLMLSLQKILFWWPVGELNPPTSPWKGDVLTTWLTGRIGSHNRTWTCDILINSQALYRLSYVGIFWSWWKELNLQPTVYKAVALPIELHQQFSMVISINGRKINTTIEIRERWYNELLRMVSGRNYRSCTCLNSYSDIRPRQLFWAWALCSQLIILIYYLSDCYFIVFTSTRITKNSCYYWFNIRVIDIVAEFFYCDFDMAPRSKIYSEGGVALAANSILLSIIYVPTSLVPPPQELLKTLVNINF